jgi:hypothetical protein
LKGDDQISLNGSESEPHNRRSLTVRSPYRSKIVRTLRFQPDKHVASVIVFRLATARALRVIERLNHHKLRCQVVVRQVFVHHREPEMQGGFGRYQDLPRQLVTIERLSIG